MARIKGNMATLGFSGSIGKTLTYRQIGGETFVSKYAARPKSDPTEKEVMARTKFGRATAYAKAAIRDPLVKSLYQSVAKKGQRAFNVAIRDALNGPAIEKIQIDFYHGGIGEKIIVLASDDFKVASVSISIYNAAGALIEEGNAVMPENKIEWIYTSSQLNTEMKGSTITAVATDMPGNTASMTQPIS